MRFYEYETMSSLPGIFQNLSGASTAAAAAAEGGAVEKKRKIIRTKKSEVPAAADDVGAEPEGGAYIFYVLKHNKIYKLVLRELIKRTLFLKWLQKFDFVMREFEEKSRAYIEHKAAAAAGAAAGAAMKKSGVMVIRRKKKA
jgi:hypothetical protein